MITVSYYDDEDNEIELSLPSYMEVCPDCEGTGYVMNESMRTYCYSQEEFEEAFPFPEDKEEYCKRGGIYDVVCPTCNGKNVVPAIDETAIPSSLKTQYAEYCKYQTKRERNDAEYKAECRLERLMGC